MSMAKGFGNRLMTMLIASPLGGWMGEGLAVVEVRGITTGHAYRTPINVEADGDGYIATSRRERTWWRNLRHGAEAVLTIRGRRRRWRCQVIESIPDVRLGLEAMFARQPARARYFNIRLGSDGRPIAGDLDQAAAERLIIHFRPADSGTEPGR
jgi:hypothetical protein